MIRDNGNSKAPQALNSSDVNLLLDVALGKLVTGAIGAEAAKAQGCIVRTKVANIRTALRTLKVTGSAPPQWLIDYASK